MGIIRPSKDGAKDATKDRNAISSVAQKHAAATTRARYGSEFIEDEECGLKRGGLIDEESESGYDDWWAGDEKGCPYETGNHERQGHWSDSSRDIERKASKKKDATRKQTSELRLYSIARGRGDYGNWPVPRHLGQG